MKKKSNLGALDAIASIAATADLEGTYKIFNEMWFVSIRWF